MHFSSRQEAFQIFFGGFAMTFPERIIQLKTDRDLLQKDIAAAIGLSLRAYQYYEKGQKEPTLSVLVRLADFFDVSLDYLVGRSDDPQMR
jgi:transcriptional regulator with XRE-family HTH domain